MNNVTLVFRGGTERAAGAGRCVAINIHHRCHSTRAPLPSHLSPTPSVLCKDTQRHLPFGLHFSLSLLVSELHVSPHIPASGLHVRHQAHVSTRSRSRPAHGIHPAASQERELCPKHTWVGGGEREARSVLGRARYKGGSVCRLHTGYMLAAWKAQSSKFFFPALCLHLVYHLEHLGLSVHQIRHTAVLARRFGFTHCCNLIWQRVAWRRDVPSGWRRHTTER